MNDMNFAGRHTYTRCKEASYSVAIRYIKICRGDRFLEYFRCAQKFAGIGEFMNMMDQAAASAYQLHCYIACIDRIRVDHRILLRREELSQIWLVNARKLQLAEDTTVNSPIQFIPRIGMATGRSDRVVVAFNFAAPL